MTFNVRILLRVILAIQQIEASADDGAGRERDVTSPKEQVAKGYESLRQKDSYWTQLWRALY